MRAPTLKWRLATGASLVALMGFAAPALAQSQAPASGDGRATQVTEVVVTAQKRSENLQNVPVAVSVVSGDQLQKANVNSAEQLIERIPSLTFRKGNTNKDSALTLRGVGTISFASGVEPSVSTVIDGVVYARGGQATQDFLDLDRVEVLRGPQGTLFGKNASAGVVSIITKSPTATPSGYVDASYYEGNEYRLRASVSGPLASTLRGSLTGFFAHYDGNGTNVYNGHDINGYEHLGARGKLVWEPTDDLTVTLIGDYSHNVDNGYADIITDMASTPFNNLVFGPALAPDVPSKKNRDINNDQDPFTKDINSGFSGQVDYKLGDFTLTSITAYRNWKNSQARDGDFTASFPQYVNTGTASGNVRSHDYGYLNFDEFTQEVRLASPTGHFLEYVAGLYYYHTWESDYFNRTVDTCTASTLATNANGLTPCAPGSSTFTRNHGDAWFATTLENYAAFGQATLNITPRFRLIGGLRETHDKVSYTFRRISTSTASFPGVNPAFSSDGDTSKNGTSGKVGVQYDVTPRIMAYASYTRGYKGPAINVFFNMLARDTGPIAPETSNAYEAGLKSKLLDSRLILNLAAFYAKYDNFQANFLDIVAGQVVTRLTNAGSVSTRGLEADFEAVPVEGLTLSGGAAYTNAHINQFNCPPGTAVACAAGINGKPLPFSPKFKGSVTADYVVPMANWIGDLDLNTAYQYQTKTQDDINQSPLAIQPAYGLWDANIALVSHDERWRAAFVVKNITNQFYTIIRVPNGTTFVRQQVPRDAERYVGVNLRYNFQ